MLKCVVGDSGIGAVIPQVSELMNVSVDMAIGDMTLWCLLSSILPALMPVCVRSSVEPRALNVIPTASDAPIYAVRRCDMFWSL